MLKLPNPTTVSVKLTFAYATVKFPTPNIRLGKLMFPPAMTVLWLAR